jgi:dephospho-CoA kinase
MNKLLRVGVTGGIGTGKSTVTNIFKLMGVPVYDADKMAKKLMHEASLASAIKKEFGNEVYKNGQLDRQYLADKVFGKEQLVNKLNSLVHPVVAKDFNTWLNRFSSGYIIKEAALLFETGLNRELDVVILVISPLDIRIERIKKRDPQRSSRQIQNIIDRQIPVNEAIGLADHIIKNDESNMLIPQVIGLHHQLINKG